MTAAPDTPATADTSASTGAVGIDALNVYCGLARISVADLFAGRGLDPARQQNIAMRERSVGLPCEDPVTNAVNAARPVVEKLTPDERASIELLVTSTESGVDYSKSVASYVHEHLGLSNRCRTVEVKQACYAATAAVQLAAGYVASGVSPGAKALVIATDVSLVDERAEYAEPAMGSGAAAVLVAADPRVLTLDLGAFGIHSYETLDSARPGPTFDVADADRSLFAYLDCLGNAFRDYAARVDGVDLATTFDLFAMHTPFAGMVRAAHRKLMREEAGLSGPAVDDDFHRRVAPALEYPSIVGNLCSGSVYLGLASLVDHAPEQVREGARVGLYSYGSGCSAEFYSGIVDERSVAAMAGMEIAASLAARVELDFATYVELSALNRECLVPHQDRDVDLDRCRPVLASYGRRREVLTFTGVKDYHRTYEWTATG